MNSDDSDSRDFQVRGYDTRRIDDISTRLARLEGKMEAMASKEDVANAKYTMTMAWIAMAVAILVGVVSIIVRFWPG